MRRFVIEREIPNIGSSSQEEFAAAARKSNTALSALAPCAQWVHSYVADNKTFCVYLAEDESVIYEHAERSGFPVNKVTEISTIIDPTTAVSCVQPAATKG